jgi:hypothetical protein
MFADPKKVDARRLRRRLKAGAAVALAMVAGAFLACKGDNNPAEPPSPSGPDARSGPGSRVAEDAGNADAMNTIAVDPTSQDAGNDASDDAHNDASDDAPDDAPNDALAVRDAAADGAGALVVRPRSPATAPKTPRVDKTEHRKGMPVRDNLLE